MRAEADRLGRPRDGAPGGSARRAPAQHRVDARDQLARVERFGQVVVGAHLQADDAVDVLALRREHDDRDRRRLRRAAAGRSASPSSPGSIRSSTTRSKRSRCELLVQRARVGHRAHREPLLGEIAMSRSRRRRSSSTTRILVLASAMAAMVAGAAGAGEELVTRGCGGSRRETGCYKPPRRSHSLLTQSVHIALTATRPAPKAAARRRSRAGQLEGRHPCSRRRRYLQRC